MADPWKSRCFSIQDRRARNEASAGCASSPFRGPQSL